MSSEDDDAESRNKIQAGRVARFFLFKNREKMSVKKAQVKGILDKSNDEKNRETNMIKTASQYLNDALGLDIVRYTKPNKKVPSDYYIIRKEEYPSEIQIPFSEAEKREFGLLAFIFFAISFNKHPITLDNIIKTIEKFEMEEAVSELGKMPNLLKKWTKEGYLTEEKLQPEQKLEYSFGPRFELEIGKERLAVLMRSIIQKHNVVEGEE
ncbi:hypothetical protein TVAG_003960 [Trichomonas vaginalis G3]|uniref:MAGE domain-containing protein n=1 Tax=Trichomonas vaginalis (strain ATCC PRA-98 / G3) TaxID=412133 RepID=A2E5B0_TRIV3|nr:melanoma-associated antigen MAGE antigen family [Trichomonas vaginalis G3]EAY12190.1 hypothetical protein TVAG_003960 [Trichomonas vaginalis G3]KAI5515423.1 melanoma-associated antigen MAGE antigen family [Trichomonas vaginalis G3]|eukprot:XP_001324413.1 hypothetical protein [Trichomonas vaginalis G3]